MRIALSSADLGVRSFDFKVKLAKPGEPIKSEDWNYIQQGLLEEIHKLREELNNMTETVILAGVGSRVGRSIGLDEFIPEEPETYGEKAMGLISKQWLTTVPGVGEICSFGIMDSFDILYYWGGAVKGNTKALEIRIDYMDRPAETVGKDLYINDRGAPPSDPDPSNPWYLALRSAMDRYWYKYKVVNPFPENEVKYVTFINKNPDCSPRIGNVIHLKSKLRKMRTYMD
jgi:hypothetical protein